jgi:succinylglutamate desuccinylase
MSLDHVQTIVSGNSGPTIAIFAGVHGDEVGGVLALEELKQTVSPKIGTLHLVLANPGAVKANTRQLTKNLNRCFDRSNIGTAKEDIRARELMDLLDECDALLDLHNFPDPNGQAFIICEPDGLEIAKLLGTEIISTGWTTAEPGASDGYMASIGKIGICMEGGPIQTPESSKQSALTAAKQFLAYFEMIDAPALKPSKKRLIHADKSIIRHEQDFYIDPALRNFEALPVGVEFGHDGQTKYIGKAGEFIIFPWPDARIGAEAYIVGHEIKA